MRKMSRGSEPRATPLKKFALKSFRMNRIIKKMAGANLAENDSPAIRPAQNHFSCLMNRREANSNKIGKTSLAPCLKSSYHILSGTSSAVIAKSAVARFFSGTWRGSRLIKAIKTIVSMRYVRLAILNPFWGKKALGQ